ncbi:hypothetical protein Aperf_G00000024489 [Anoplocephala perfoliata]
MSLRRQPFHRVNPTYVPPSRHTIFIRGLPGSTNVDVVKNHFSSETDTKCTVEFFSTSEDRVRFSVAIRFKSHEIAREMLERYNGKELLGHPVEVTWFKDLKKARARAFEEQRHGRFRAMRGLRGNYRGYPERRGRGYSPSHGRDRSYSGGPSSSRNLSRGPSGSSHSSSRSHSGSPAYSHKRFSRRIGPDAEGDSVQGNDGYPRISRKRLSRRSRSASSRSRSSSRSMSNRSHSNHVVPVRRSGQGPRSPSLSRSSFSNAPPPPGNDHGGSGLLNNLIQLPSKRIASKPTQLRGSASQSHSGSSLSPSPRRQHQSQKHRSPLLPGLLPSSSKDQSPEKEPLPLPTLSGSNWRPLSLAEEIPDEPAPSRSLFAAYSNDKPKVVNGKIILSPLIPQKSSNMSSEMDVEADLISSRKGDALPADINHEFPKQDKSSKSKDVLIQEKKAVIEEEYKKDCETFATVVKMFISKDSELEEKLLPLLKKILHERGQQSIEELRVYIESLEENGRTSSQ